MKLIVLAKAPVPGFAKTRLCPPCTPDEAARIAEAALIDTIVAAKRTNGIEPVLVVDGDLGPLADGLPVVAQRGDGLDERIANAYADVGGPAIQIGMDTPQVTPALLRTAADLLATEDVDAVLGDADDGGWWISGLVEPRPDAFVGVEMSSPSTGRAQRERWRELGLRVADVPQLRDVDTMDDAVAIAASVTGGRFRATVLDVTRGHDRVP